MTDYNTEFETVFELKPFLKCGYGPTNHRMPGKNYWLQKMPLFVRKHKGVLEFKNIIIREFKPSYKHIGHMKLALTTRTNSITQQILSTDKKYNLKNFDWVAIQLSDGPSKHPSDFFNGRRKYKAPVLFACSDCLSRDLPHVVPDPTFWAWPDARIDSYQEATKTLSMLGDTKVDNYTLGWRGSGHYGKRKGVITEHQDNPNFDFKASSCFLEISNGYVQDKNFIHMYDQVKMWRYFLDLRGATYSSRTKYLLFTKRLVFAQKFTFKEWFYTNLRPWVHYVPINDTLDDIEEKYQMIRDDPKLEEQIVNNAYDFAMNNCTFDHALARWNEVLSKY